jgi:NAD(P)H-flavin reductase
VAGRRGPRGRPRDRSSEHDSPGRARLGGPSSRTARRRPPDRGRRLPGAAQLLDRLRPRRAGARADTRGGPLLLVAGGSGIGGAACHAGTGTDVEAALLLSSCGWDDVIYRDELERLTGDHVRVVHTLTRSQPDGWTGYARRVDAEMLSEAGVAAAERPLSYVCGPTPFVEAVASALVDLGHDSTLIRTERFGPTGG